MVEYRVDSVNWLLWSFFVALDFLVRLVLEVGHRSSFIDVGSNAHHVLTDMGVGPIDILRCS